MADQVKEETPFDAASDPEYEADLARKRKSKSPSVFREHDTKRSKDNDDIDPTEDIAKQYKKFKAAPKYNLYSEEVYCVCRKPDHGGELMVGCDGCEEWFHFKCMKLNLKNQKLIDSFFCKFCQWQGKGVTRWNRKCRLPTCHNPVRKNEKSKYCSDECGLQYLGSKLTGSSVMSPNDIKLVITYCANYEDLAKMGHEFPELPEVRQLDLDKLPPQIRQELTNNTVQQEKIVELLKAAELRGDYLAKIREKVKLLNEKLQQKVEPGADAEDNKKSKKKKSKLRKIDLCYFNPNLAEECSKDEYEKVAQLCDVYATFKTEIDDIVANYTEEGAPEYTGPVCLKDRRKCLKHNGWLNLLIDQAWKRRTELEQLLSQFQQYRADALRDYSILKYEADVDSV